MKAVVCERYGAAADLSIRELPKPVPVGNQVLVKIAATAINDWDWSLVRGRPKIYRLFYGLFKPKKKVFGVELSGTVEETGPEVSILNKGDRVYGDISLEGWGAWAEYVAVPETALVKMPDVMGYNEAASLPHAAGLAYQGLVTAGRLEKGQDLLINGAGGGVGTLGVQIARSIGARVSGVDSAEKLSLMEDLGFEEVMDYRKTDFTKTGKKYQLVLDTKTTRWPLALLRSLKPGGNYVTVGGSPGRILLLALMSRIIFAFSGKKLQLLTLKPNVGLEEISALYAAGKLKPVIDGPYPLEAVPEQLARFGQGKHLGKIVIII